jgi:hypothetical protein
VDELTALARDHNVHIHLVHHIRKLASEDRCQTKMMLKVRELLQIKWIMFCYVAQQEKRAHDSKYEEIKGVQT